VKKLKIRNIEFHINESNKQASKSSSNTYCPFLDVDDIKKGIKDLKHAATNIWNIKKCGTKIALHIFYDELKPENNNKVIYDICSITQ